MKARTENRHALYVIQATAGPLGRQRNGPLARSPGCRRTLRQSRLRLRAARVRNRGDEIADDSVLNKSMDNFARIADGRERWCANHNLPRHGHDQAYAAVVLSGGYEECGSRGRFRVGPGDVLLHGAFDAHLDRFQRQGAQILNLVVESPGFGLGRMPDPDAIARAAECDPVEARAQLREQVHKTERGPQDWPDILACDLISDPGCRLERWAEEHGLAAETISRGFGKMFGITPAAFRLEVRARRAFALIVGSSVPLASVAAATGFADQAHMSRATRALTGRPPRAWRRSNPFKTAAAAAV
jgi:AraC-like DNA-binding protein